MKSLINVLSIVLVVCAAANHASGQDRAINPNELHQFVVMPRDLGLPLLVAQPEAPLEFVETRLLVNVGSGNWVPSFRIRNRGTKPIVAFTVASAYGDEWGWKAQGSDNYLMPGRITSLEEDSRDEIVPLTETLQDRLKLRGSMKGIIALLVVRVQYVDGSEFRESGYDALGKFFYTMHGALSDRHFWSRKQQQ